ncbi:hypothetical protein B0A49_01741 [Cryomyces minteri]|uniref:Uncharacterized protein n=1 Tax=Cryomyces minteri TaxID=331657 RepID=A0A4U0XPT0_9PEZI|nr:hypothetical protein B0A49_01741 [Cryomyces minteri]
MPDWKKAESFTRLLAAMVAATPEMKLDYRKIASYYGEGATYDSVEGRFRVIKKEAQQLKAEIEGGVRAEAPPRGTTKSPRKPRTPKKAADSANGVKTGRVTKSANGTPSKKRVIKEEPMSSTASSCLDDITSPSEADTNQPSFYADNFGFDHPAGQVQKLGTSVKMPIKWTAENDNLLFLKTLETHDVNFDAKKIAAAWPTDKGEVPTARAITERLVKIRKNARANGVGHFGISSAQAKSASTPRSRHIAVATPPSRKTPKSGGLTNGKRRRAATRAHSDADDDGDEDMPRHLSQHEVHSLGGTPVSAFKRRCGTFATHTTNGVSLADPLSHTPSRRGEGCSNGDGTPIARTPGSRTPFDTADAFNNAATPVNSTPIPFALSRLSVGPSPSSIANGHSYGHNGGASNGHPSANINDNPASFDDGFSAPTFDDNAAQCAYTRTFDPATGVKTTVTSTGRATGKHDGLGQTSGRARRATVKAEQVCEDDDDDEEVVHDGYFEMGESDVSEFMDEEVGV